MTPNRPTSITVIAWVVIITAGLGALFNIYGFAASVPPFPRWVWAALFFIKSAAFAAGLLLLKMRRLAVWIFVVVMISGQSLSLGVTSHLVEIPTWRYAASLVVLSVYAFFIIRHWDKLLPNKSTDGALADA